MEEQEVIVEEELKNNLPPKITKETFEVKDNTKKGFLHLPYLNFFTLKIFLCFFYYKMMHHHFNIRI